MIGFFMKGISAVAAAVFTILAIGVSYFSVTPEIETDVLSPAQKGIEAESKIITTVHVLNNYEELSFALQQAIELYSADIPESIKFTVQTVGNEHDYRSMLRAKLLSGEDADLFKISGAREAFELERYLFDVSGLPWIDKAYAFTLNPVSHDGKIYGVPYSVEAFGLICNSEIFSEAEITLSEIQSFEALEAAFDNLKAYIEDGEPSEAIAELEAVCEFAAQDKDFLGNGFADIALTDSFNSQKDAALAKYVSFPAQEPVEKLLKLIAKNAAESNNDWSGLATVTQARQLERFANGRVAVILGDTNTYKRINEINPNIRGKAFLTPIPLDTFEQASVYASAPEYWAVNVNSNDAVRNAATGFLTWLYRSDEGAGILAKSFEAVSPFSDTAKSTGVTLHSQMVNYLQADMVLPRLHAECPRSWGKDVFAPNVQSYFTDRQRTWDISMQISAEGWNG